MNDAFFPQFLHSETDKRSVLESHLLLLTEDGCESGYEEMYSFNLLLNRWAEIICFGLPGQKNKQRNKNSI